MNQQTGSRQKDQSVANFLASLDGLTHQEAVANCEADKAAYGWSHETSGAIREGISKHFGSRRDDPICSCPLCNLTESEHTPDAPPSNSAVPPCIVSPPLDAGVVASRALVGPTAEDVTSARQHLQVALMQVLPSDDEIIVGHMREAYALLGGKL